MIKSFSGKTPRIHHTSFISEAACIIGDVEIGECSSVWPGAVVRGDAARIRLGSFTVIEDRCVLHAHREMEIGDDVVIGHGAVVHDCRIGSKVLVGMNASLLPGSRIGDLCVIAAGSVIDEGTDVPSGSLVAGVPARVIGRIPKQFREWSGTHSYTYPDLAKLYLADGL